MVIVPPYCGVPRLSHQFPVEVVVTVVGKLDAEVVVKVGSDAEVVVEVGSDAKVVVEVDAVVLDLPHDASSIATTIKKLKPNQIPLFLIKYLLLINNRHIFAVF